MKYLNAYLLQWFGQSIPKLNWVLQSLLLDYYYYNIHLFKVELGKNQTFDTDRLYSFCGGC